MCMLEAGRWASRISTRGRSAERAIRAARRLIDEVFEVTDRKWRGIGTIPQSGFACGPNIAEFDAESRFAVASLQVARIDDVHQRADFARRPQAARLSGVWKDLHAGTSAGGDDGFFGGGLCGLLQLRSIPQGGARATREEHDAMHRDSAMPTPIDFDRMTCPMPLADLRARAPGAWQRRQADGRPDPTCLSCPPWATTSFRA